MNCGRTTQEGIMLQLIPKVSKKKEGKLLLHNKVSVKLLKQVVKDKAIFNATSKRKLLSIEQWTTNVPKLINDAATMEKQPKHAPYISNWKKVKHTLNDRMFTGIGGTLSPEFRIFKNCL